MFRLFCTLIPSIVLSRHDAAAQTVEEFYKGKQITLIVSAEAGTGYDIYSRLLGRYMNRFIPGNPVIVVQNMQGASGIRAANYLYNVAPRDGTTFGTVHRGTIADSIFLNDKVKIDPRKLSWIGGLSTELSFGAAWHGSGLNNFDDAFTHAFPVSASGVTGDGYVFANVLNHVLGTKFKIITGYKGTSDEQLAMERGEVAGRIGWAWGAIQVMAADLLARGDIKLVVLLSSTRPPGFENVPLVADFAKSEEERRILDLTFAPMMLGRSYFAPPGIPEDRLSALRQAFETTVDDKAFLAEAKALKVDIQYIPAQNLVDLIERLHNAPHDLVDKAERAKKGDD